MEVEIDDLYRDRDPPPPQTYSGLIVSMVLKI